MQRQPIAISYIRFSTAEQDKGDSFRRQLASSQDWCARNGWTLDISHRLNDLGLSGFRGRNAKIGKLKAFIDGLESGNIVCDGIIVESLDRLGRDEVGDMLRLFLNILSYDVKIITTTPENIFDKKSINEPANLIMAILEICRGFSESNVKSERVAAAWKNKKTNAREGHKVSSQCPGWLILDKQKNTFSFHPEKTKAVRRLIQLAHAGMGMASIAKILNQEKHATLREHAKHWHASSVHKTLQNRALFGEYQPRFSNRYISEKHRQPDGEPIANYYVDADGNALISEAEYLQIQAGLKLRRNIHQPISGGHSRKVTNLFARIMKDAVTGATIVRIDKGKKAVPCYISDQVRAGITKERNRFPADDYEYHFLMWLSEVDIAALSNEPQITEAKKRLLIVRGDIEKTQKKLKKLKARLAEEDEIESIIDVIKTLDKKLKTLKAEEEGLAIETARNNPASEAGSIAKALERAVGDELIELRSKLRFLIVELIETIYVRMDCLNGKRWCFSQIHFRNGLIRKLAFVSVMTYQGGGATNPMPTRKSYSISSTPRKLDRLDLRNETDFAKWYSTLLMEESDDAASNAFCHNTYPLLKH